MHFLVVYDYLVTGSSGVNSLMQRAATSFYSTVLFPHSGDAILALFMSENLFSLPGRRLGDTYFLQGATQITLTDGGLSEKRIRIDSAKYYLKSLNSPLTHRRGARSA